MAQAPSKAPVVEKAQQDPHCSWSFFDMTWMVGDVRVDVSNKNRGYIDTPQNWMGENHGKSLSKWMIWRETHYFWKHPIWISHRFIYWHVCWQAIHKWRHMTYGISLYWRTNVCNRMTMSKVRKLAINVGGSLCEISKTRTFITKKTMMDFVFCISLHIVQIRYNNIVNIINAYIHII